MSLYNIISENAVLRLSDFIANWNVKKHLKFLLKSQWWSEDEIKSYQEEKLQKLIQHSYDNVPYYTELLKNLKLTPEDFNSLEDIKKIPTISKEKIVENFNNGKIIAKNINRNKVIFGQSSGSTGLRTRYYIDKNAYGYNLACNLRGWYWMGYRLGDKIIKVSQNKRKSKLKVFQDYFDRTRLFANQYDDKNLNDFIGLMNDFAPNFLRSYPDPLVFIANYLNNNSVKIPSLKGINTTGNTLFLEVRNLVENTFNTKVFDSYSCEGGPNFFECPTHEYYHCSSEYGIAEIINTQGEEVKKGEKGNLVVTNLHNYAVPFIRYESKDIVEKGDKCSCGRNHLTIKSILGRNNDIIITPGKQYLIAQTFTTYFKYFEIIEQFQVHQISKNELVFNLVIKGKWNKKIENRIISYWKDYTNNEMNISINILDHISLLQSDKRRFLVRDESVPIEI